MMSSPHNSRFGLIARWIVEFAAACFKLGTDCTAGRLVEGWVDAVPGICTDTLRSPFSKDLLVTRGDRCGARVGFGGILKVRWGLVCGTVCGGRFGATEEVVARSSRRITPCFAFSAA